MRGVRAPLVAAAVAAGATAAITSRRQFIAKLDALDHQLAEGQHSAEPRSDLPKQVAALATRLGATGISPALFVDLRQIGAMWFKRGGAPQRFTARQRIGTTSAGFVWRAKVGPLGAMWVVDALVAGSGFLEARVLGILRVARIEGTAAATQGEALRYLAELPFNPDAILFD